MKYRKSLYLLSVAFLCLSLVACPGTGGSDPKPPPPPGDGLDDIVASVPSSTTPIGKSVSGGQLNEIVIGSEGGSLTSNDGVLRLVIPTGAVMDVARFGFQLIENRMPTGIGLGYRVTAKDINDNDLTFSKPLRLEFAFRQNEFEDVDPGNLLVAYQGLGGRWEINSDQQAGLVSRDGTNPIIHVIGNFNKSGDYVITERYSLNPVLVSVKVNANVHFMVTKFQLAGFDANSHPMYDFFDFPMSDWSVNGVLGGNTVLGQVVASGKSSNATYKSPSRKPNPNRVKIMAQGNDGATSIKLISRVQIEDQNGWVNYSTKTVIQKSFNREGDPSDIGTFDIDGELNLTMSLESSSVYAPTYSGGQPVPGRGIYNVSLQPNPNFYYLIKYNRVVKGSCGCGLKGTYEHKYHYAFNDINKLALPNGNTPFHLEVQHSGAYQLEELGSLEVTIPGSYQYNFEETKTCEGALPMVPVNESGNDIVLVRFSPLKTTGTLKPTGPDRIKKQDRMMTEFSHQKRQRTYP